MEEVNKELYSSCKGMRNGGKSEEGRRDVRAERMVVERAEDDKL
jgi:hypothetical protein